MKTPKNVEAQAWKGEIPLQSLYTAGVGGQISFEALRARGELVGTRCAACEQVYVPARLFCERCMGELKEEVKVGPGGTLVSFTFSAYDRDAEPLEEPMALALVRLDGATTVFLHRLLKVTSPEQVQIGSRVKAVLKAKPKRTGSILDIEGFELL